MKCKILSTNLHSRKNSNIFFSHTKSYVFLKFKKCRKKSQFGFLSVLSMEPWRLKILDPALDSWHTSILSHYIEQGHKHRHFQFFQLNVSNYSFVWTHDPPITGAKEEHRSYERKLLTVRLYNCRSINLSHEVHNESRTELFCLNEAHD